MGFRCSSALKVNSHHATKLPDAEDIVRVKFDDSDSDLSDVEDMGAKKSEQRRQTKAKKKSKKKSKKKRKRKKSTRKKRKKRKKVLFKNWRATIVEYVPSPPLEKKTN